MARHIRVKAELIFPYFTQVKVTILEQTHFGAEFGNKASDWYSARQGAMNRFTNNKFHLESFAYYLPRQVGKSKFRVLGNRNQLAENNIAYVSAEEWPKLKRAIQQYNKKFAD